MAVIYEESNIKTLEWACMNVKYALHYLFNSETFYRDD